MIHAPQTCRREDVYCEITGASTHLNLPQVLKDFVLGSINFPVRILHRSVDQQDQHGHMHRPVNTTMNAEVRKYIKEGRVRQGLTWFSTPPVAGTNRDWSGAKYSEYSFGGILPSAMSASSRHAVS